MKVPELVEDYHPIGTQVEFEGRYYWLDGALLPGMLQENRKVNLMSMRPDGSDRKLLGELWRAGITPVWLVAKQRRLYLLYRHHVGQTVLAADGYLQAPKEVDQILAEIRPDAPSHLRSLLQIPVTATSAEIDPPYLYYALQETHRSVFDVLSPIGTETTESWYYRIRLTD